MRMIGWRQIPTTPMGMRPLRAGALTHDFENRLVRQNSDAVTIVYDGDGNRVAKTVGGVTTKYLVDDGSSTGYAQVLEETVAGTVQRVYSYGLNRISQSQASGTSFYTTGTGMCGC